jgi:hypothetical protein
LTIIKIFKERGTGTLFDRQGRYKFEERILKHATHPIFF